MRTRVVRRLGVVVGILAVAATGAEAIDLRSWDQKISDPTRRFVVLAAFDDQAVLDKETQLVWERTPMTVPLAFRQAADRCLLGSIGGRRGWRLPTVHELMSLLTPIDVLPAGGPFVVSFPGSSQPIWSSTPNRTLDGSLRFQFIVLTDNHPGQADLPTTQKYVWCVRGPASDAAGY